MHADVSGCQLDARLWGKEKGLSRPYPVVCHLLDTAVMAGALWDAVLSRAFRRRLADRAGVSVAVMRRLVSFWAGLHDIGKITPPFVVMHRPSYLRLEASGDYSASAGAERESLQHDLATQWVLAELLPGFGYPVSKPLRESVHHQIAQLLGGHHGCFHQVPKPRLLAAGEAVQPGLGRRGWGEQRRAHAGVLRRLTRSSEAPAAPLPGDVAVVVAGLVVVADWLSSQERLIEARMPPADWRADDTELRAHGRRAREEAPAVLAAARLGRVSYARRAFTSQFPHIAQPNALQRSLAQELPSLVRGQGLLLITAPTGDGKTEAALHAVSLLARAVGASGMYFALPTMATADAMLGRVAAFSGDSVRGPKALTLLHSMAWLSAWKQTSKGGVGAVVSEDSVTRWDAGRWLRTGERGILAPLSVGTIDQALTGVLPVRHNALRLFGLSNKVFVVDEAHAYGPWMHSLLVRLLEWLGAMGASVVLLSATLAGKTATSLVEAYRRGCGFREPQAVQPRYPGWLFVDGSSGDVSAARAVETARPRRLRLDVRAVTWDPAAPDDREPARGSRRAALVDALVPAIESGGCVLVCCATVEESQRTFRFLRARLSGRVAAEDLRLLHSRYPAFRRSEITEAVERCFGKPGTDRRTPGRPRPSVLIATSIVEQSLDLDVDLVISDLAPLAQLLQRAGRCHRHDRADRAPGMAGGPRLVVLEPRNEQGVFVVPRSWGAVYSESLLRRTSVLLGENLDTGISVPEDVQRLVDEVYAEDFGSRLDEAARVQQYAADVEHQAQTMAEEQLSRLTAIPPPEDVVDLARLSNDGDTVDEGLITTRLGADSERAVCVFVQPDGTTSLRPDVDFPVPMAHGGKLSTQQLASIMSHVVPLPGPWLAGRTDDEVPAGWADHPTLRRLAVLVMRQVGEQWTCQVGGRHLEYSDLGVHPSFPPS